MKCNKCGLNSSNKELYVPTYRKEGEYRNLCLSCHRLRSKKYRDKFRNLRKEIIREAKNIPCTDCNITYPYYVMEFDHISDDKKFTIGDGWFNSSLEDIQNEITKCEIVCSNCHRIRTHKRKLG